MALNYINRLLALDNPAYFECVPRAWEGRLACYACRMAGRSQKEP